MRTTLVIDDDVFEAAMHIARTSDQRIGQVISELARRGLNPPPQVQIVQSGRFPAFAVPPDAPPMDPDVVQRVLDEEGF
jgi:hypothetical protein